MLKRFFSDLKYKYLLKSDICVSIMRWKNTKLGQIRFLKQSLDKKKIVSFFCFFFLFNYFYTFLYYTQFILPMKNFRPTSWYEWTGLHDKSFLTTHTMCIYLLRMANMTLGGFKV